MGHGHSHLNSPGSVRVIADNLEVAVVVVVEVFFVFPDIVHVFFKFLFNAINKLWQHSNRIVLRMLFFNHLKILIMV